VLAGLALSLLSACPSSGRAIVVETSAHQMELCQDGAPFRTYDVAIGSGGAVPIERRIGWAVTPKGHFTLRAPIPSAQFHVFIPLENPAPGRFSAWAIGLHGPPRSSRSSGHSNVESDWTWGCVAVASDEAIDEIAAWVRERRVRRIEVR
jgi:hypothetical protein